MAGKAYRVGVRVGVGVMVAVTVAVEVGERVGGEFEGVVDGRLAVKVVVTDAKVGITVVQDEIRRAKINPTQVDPVLTG